jgi:hypothetical protein
MGKKVCKYCMNVCPSKVSTNFMHCDDSEWSEAESKSHQKMTVQKKRRINEINSCAKSAWYARRQHRTPSPIHFKLCTVIGIDSLYWFLKKCVVYMYKCSNSCLWCSCWWNLDFSFKSYDLTIKSKISGTLESDSLFGQTYW